MQVPSRYVAATHSRRVGRSRLFAATYRTVQAQPRNVQRRNVVVGDKVSPFGGLDRPALSEASLK
jgi:hypothetical protein